MAPLSIGIAGAGLVGRVLALNLVQMGHSVTFFEKDSHRSENAAGLTAAGMLAPYAELETAESAIFESGQRSIQLWPNLLKQLGIAEAFQAKGSLITAHPTDMPELNHFVAQLQAKVDAASEIQTLNKAQIAELEPELSLHSKAYYLPSEAQVNAQAFMETSSAFLAQHDQVTWFSQTEVTEISANQIQTATESHRFDWVFDTRGLGAKPDLTNLRGVRGEVFWLDAPEVTIQHPVRLMHPRYRLYIVPRPNHRYVVGATEIESEDRSEMSVRSTLEMLSAAYSVHPGFGEARIAKMLTNCRPALSNNLPDIQTETGFSRINGLYRHGYLLAPAVVEQALVEAGLLTRQAA